ncbi:MAG: transketolase [Chitinivibrionales bacterium]|nr:transketolase [Chitinivibrionales bacterium]
MSNDHLKRTADNIRILSAAMVEKAKSGHPGGAMGGADFIAVLYSEFLQFDPSNFAWQERDRFFLDPGHMSPMLYSVLNLYGAFSKDDIQQFRQWESPTPGHPELERERGIENTSGPLGQGHAMALGNALAERFFAARFGEWIAHKTYAYISDGGVQEEISQGVGRLAGHLGIGNLIMYYDSNDIQLSSETSIVTSEDTAKKYEAWGWAVETIDGHDIDQIRAALKRANEETDRPSLIIGKTVMGKGAVTENGESYEREVSTHGMPLSKAGASFEKTIGNLGGDPKDPFAIFSDVTEFVESVKKEKISAAKKKQNAKAKWVKENSELATKLEKFMAMEFPEIDYKAIEQKAGCATRKASGAVLAVYAKEIENIIVSSADLSNSDNTDSFLKNSKVLTKGDFSGNFLQSGVSELTMSAVMNGIALHGGIVPVCGTFFVFSDYMKPAVRLAALMALRVKYVWTHDAFRVGEDGPTHQPIEHEAQIRLLEQFNNLNGNRAMLVLRPADGIETTVAWKVALEYSTGPVALILSRQNISDIPVCCVSRYEDALAAEKGAYTVKKVDGKPDLVLIANGSEVSTLIEASSLLESKKSLKVQVVSAIAEAFFHEQSEEYQESVVPFGVPVFGLTAGLPAALRGLVGPFGKVVGMKRFGASAPYKVLDDKFGYTAENVVKQVEIYLEEFKTTITKVKQL